MVATDTLSKPEEFRRKAIQSQLKARISKRSDSRERWLMIAKHWRHLARDAEALRSRDLNGEPEPTGSRAVKRRGYVSNQINVSSRGTRT